MDADSLQYRDGLLPAAGSNACIIYDEQRYRLLSLTTCGPDPTACHRAQDEAVFAEQIVRPYHIASRSKDEASLSPSPTSQPSAVHVDAPHSYPAYTRRVIVTASSSAQTHTPRFPRNGRMSAPLSCVFVAWLTELLHSGKGAALAASRSGPVSPVRLITNAGSVNAYRFSFVNV